MPPDRVERRLAAILATNVAGYSRIMEADTAVTLAQHHGHMIKLMGDGTLMEFASVVDAGLGEGA